MTFKLKSPFKPAGDQPAAIEALSRGLRDGRKHQTLLGVTGSGKTFTLANVIARAGRPVLVISHNKVLAAQLYGEFKSFFPENAVEYFISYYDYYQPEAYLPHTDTYIEKDAAINEHIDRLRLKAVASLLSRRDVIVVASVSCIYNIGDPADFQGGGIALTVGEERERDDLTRLLTAGQYQRNETAFSPGTFSAKGGRVMVYPPYSEHPLRLTLEGGTLACIEEIHRATAQVIRRLPSLLLFPAKQFVTPWDRMQRALASIEQELKERLRELQAQNKLVEAQRLDRRTRYDMAMMRSVGYCNGVENYSRHLSGRPPGSRPFCLLDYFPKDFLTVIDESHVTLPQVRGMYEGDRSRKETLVEHGFRLPSALDNRPLKFQEFVDLTGQVMYVSATPGPYELSQSGGEIVEQIVRPTGLVDPEVEIHPIQGQIEHLIRQVQKGVSKKQRTLVTTLTKRMAEDLCAYLAKRALKVRYLHSDIAALDRIKILKDLRRGNFDVLVGVNLLREGLDLPEVSCVAVLDADKEGFLRSQTSLIQICGRAARNVDGRVLLYADNITGSMSRALEEMERRRKKQIEYNRSHRITPRTIVKEVAELEEFEMHTRRIGLCAMRSGFALPEEKKKIPQLIKEVERQMKEAAEVLDFELAAQLRDQLFELKAMTAKAPASKTRRCNCSKINPL